VKAATRPSRSKKTVEIVKEGWRITAPGFMKNAFVNRSVAPPP
jgi:hypothetical protein